MLRVTKIAPRGARFQNQLVLRLDGRHALRNLDSRQERLAGHTGEIISHHRPVVGQHRFVDARHALDATDPPTFRTQTRRHPVPGIVSAGFRAVGPAAADHLQFVERHIRDVRREPEVWIARHVERDRVANEDRAIAPGALNSHGAQTRVTEVESAVGIARHGRRSGIAERFDSSFRARNRMTAEAREFLLVIGDGRMRVVPAPPEQTSKQRTHRNLPFISPIVEALSHTNINHTMNVYLRNMGTVRV